MAWIITGLIILGGLHQQGLDKKKKEGYERKGKVVITKKVDQSSNDSSRKK